MNDNSTTEYYFTNPDSYAKADTLLYKHRQRNFWFGEDEHIHVRNISAYWIPELTITKKIHGTVYTVTGSYEGTETFVRKLRRITGKKFTENLEDYE